MIIRRIVYPVFVSLNAWRVFLVVGTYVAFLWILTFEGGHRVRVSVSISPFRLLELLVSPIARLGQFF